MSVRQSKPRVAVLGAGVAGLTVAHELVERGFDVVLCERRDCVGGKSRSYRARIDVQGEPVEVPAEHGFRFLPGFYRHLDDTMRRIPLPPRLAINGRKTVLDCVVSIRDEKLALGGGQNITLPVATEYTIADLKRVLGLSNALLTVGVTQQDLEVFASKVWQLVTSCPERRATEYEGVGWREFVQAFDRSDEYYWYLATGLTRALVAARARRASTKTIGNVALRLVADALHQGSSADRVLAGPTSDVWIDPWLSQIRALAREKGAELDLRLGAEVIDIEMHGQRIQRVRVKRDGREAPLEADIYVSALPLEILSRLVERSNSFRDADGDLASHLLELAEPSNGHLQWMSGLQIYLRKDVSINPGHQLFLDSPWGLTSISQRQFWDDGYLPPGVGGVLSIDISNWEAPGLDDAPPANARRSREDVFKETLRQLRAALPEGTLGDDNIVGWHLDEAIVGPNISGKSCRPVATTNLEPILVNGVNTWRLRPAPRTRIDNFFIAGDFVQTETDLACMEGASEAARRVVNHVLDRFGYEGSRCWVEASKEPPLLTLLQQRDERRYARGLPWSDVDWGPSLLVGAQAADKALQLAFPPVGQQPHAPAAPAGGWPQRRPRAEWDDRESDIERVLAVGPDRVTELLGTRYARAGRADPMFKRWRPYLLEDPPGTLVPFHVYQGSTLIIHGLADYDYLSEQTRGTGYTPVAAQLGNGGGRPKHGYAELWIMQYADTTEGPYAEIVVNFVVSRRERKYRWTSTYSSLVPMMDPDNRLFAIQLLLHEHAPTRLGPIEYGRRFFGFDKRPARIDILDHGRSRTFECSQGKDRVLWGRVNTDTLVFDTVRDTAGLAQELGILDTAKNAKQALDGAELYGGLVTRDINNPALAVEVLAVYKFAPKILRWLPDCQIQWNPKTDFGHILDGMRFDAKIACQDDRLRSVLYKKGWPRADVA